MFFKLSLFSLNSLAVSLLTFTWQTICNSTCVNKKRLLLLSAFALLFGGIAALHAQKIVKNTQDEQSISQARSRKVLYFTPEIYPNVSEIQEPTNMAFFSAVSDEVSQNRNRKMVRVESPVEYESADAELIKEFCKNNNADYAVIPRVKYFKVGLGQFVFSNQVVVSLKLYDADGNFISENNYDTFRRNVRILGSTENFVKIGASGAVKDLFKSITRYERRSN